MTDKDAYIEKLERDLREARDGERLLSAEVEGAKTVCRGWRVAAIVGWLCFAAQVAVNVLKWL